jgi:hypothetical protein
MDEIAARITEFSYFFIRRVNNAPNPAILKFVCVDIVGSPNMKAPEELGYGKALGLLKYMGVPCRADY